MLILRFESLDFDPPCFKNFSCKVPFRNAPESCKVPHEFTVVALNIEKWACSCSCRYRHCPTFVTWSGKMAESPSLEKLKSRDSVICVDSKLMNKPHSTPAASCAPFLSGAASSCPCPLTEPYRYQCHLQGLSVLFSPYLPPFLQHARLLNIDPLCKITIFSITKFGLQRPLAIQHANN